MTLQLWSVLTWHRQTDGAKGWLDVHELVAVCFWVCFFLVGLVLFFSFSVVYLPPFFCFWVLRFSEGNKERLGAKG